MASAKQNVATLRAELDKLRDHIASRPSGVEHEIIQVPIATRRQEALEESLKRFAEDNPMSSAVEVIEEYARQIESGLGALAPSPGETNKKET